MKEKLENLLKENQRLEELYGNRKSIHLPMTLIAMFKMGAEEDELEAYFQSIHGQYSFPYTLDQFMLTGKNTQLEISETKIIDDDNWKNYLGQYDLFKGYIPYFRKAFQKNGRDETLRRSLPTLITSLSAHAFHPLIRLGYSLEIDNDEEIIFSLAYWAATHYKFPEIETQKPKISPQDFLQKLKDTVSFHHIEFSSNIDYRIKQVLGHPDFTSQLRPIDLSEATGLQETSMLLLNLFLNTKDFTILHGVTSCHALSYIQPYCSNFSEVLSYYWHAIGASYITVGAPKLNKAIIEHDNLLDWESLQEKAVKSKDEHIIKFVDTCYSEVQKNPSSLYQYAALKQIESPAVFCLNPVFEGSTSVQRIR